MASGKMPGGEDLREKQRWVRSSNNNNKVYTRKNHNKSKNSGDDAHQNFSQQTLATTTDDNNSQQRPPLVSGFEAVASDDSSSHDLVQLGAHIGTNVGSGIPGYSKLDNRVKISMNSVSKFEVRGLKRRLVSELDQVRSLVKRLEAKEVQVTGYGNSRNHSQFSANEMVVDKVLSGVRVNSEVGSVGPANSRPYRGLSVSIAAENSQNHGSGYGGGDEFVEKEKRTPKANQYYKDSYFVLGKEKLNPAESSKMFKSSIGGKRDGDSGGCGHEGFGLDNGSSKLFKSCNNLLAKLMKHKFGWVFNEPVDVKKLGLHDYYLIVKHPMDLGTVKSRLSKNWYKSAKEFAEDVRLTFSNAMLYNPKGQDVHYMAEELSNIFAEKWNTIEAEHNLNKRFEAGHDVGLLMPASRRAPAPPALAPVAAPTPAPPPDPRFVENRILERAESMTMPVAAPTPAPPPDPRFVENRILERAESMTMPVDSRSKTMSSAHVVRTPAPKKPKAKDTVKRDMTYEEKQRLSINLQNLPSEKLDNIVQIIRKRNPGLFQKDDEIEVDIDSVDAETLWELDTFVTNYKKSLSKNKRKTELTVRASAETGHDIQKTNWAPAVAETPKAAEAVERTVVTSPVQQKKQVKVDNWSGLSGSSSSGSDSGSSSGSGNDNSSGYGSDGGNSPRC